MRKLALFAAVVCLISCCSMDAFAQAVVGTSRYIGYSAALANGGNRTGLAGGMNYACIATYGTGAHMCTTDEFFATAGISVNTLQIWVQPSLRNCVYNSNLGQTMCEESGEDAPVPESNLYQTCGGWTLPVGNLGTTVTYGTTTGWVLQTNADCSQLHRIACCYAP